ncbi:MAG TPA: hypothetical protein VME69_14965 [Methylocella sp.]|nr:hypothetical protein [Methylocella sp.]
MVIVLFVVFTFGFTFFADDCRPSRVLLEAVVVFAIVLPAVLLAEEDFLAADFFCATDLTVLVLTAAGLDFCLLVSSADRLGVVDFGLRVAACCVVRLTADDFMVFLTDAITSALLLPVPLWRRDG